MTNCLFDFHFFNQENRWEKSHVFSVITKRQVICYINVKVAIVSHGKDKTFFIVFRDCNRKEFGHFSVYSAQTVTLLICKAIVLFVFLRIFLS